ncbi:MAG: MFS transporter [Candidatus Bathyarchaeota archaeon]|nr:MFS transporter [Candidatus Bathyarchaeota archaeon]MDH5786794.1 MFS transporter [Candidatus Bathyarchaeota archaeon]
MEKPLWMICTTHMFIEVYLLMQVALIPVVIREFQLNLLEASLVATVPSLITLLMNIPSGFLADRFNAGQLLFASMLIEGLSTFLISQTNNFWTLVLGVSLLKISSPMYHISGLSQLSRLAKPEEISRSIGFHNALGNLGSAMGLITLSVFLSSMGWRLTYLFWAIPILCWGFIVLKYSHFKTKPKAKTEHKENKRKFARLSLIFSTSFLILLIVIGVRELGATGSSTFMTTYFVDTRGLSEATASLVFSLGPFIGIIGSIGGGYLGERIGAKKALAWAILCSSISLFMLSLASQLYLIILIYLFYSFFGSAIWSPMNTIVARVTPETERGMSYSLYFFTEGLLASFTPTIAAGVIELTDIWFIFPFSVAFQITSIIILRFLPLPKQR